MRCVLSLSFLPILLPVFAQDTAPPSKLDTAVDEEIRAAQTARNPELLEKRAVDLEGIYQYEDAQKLLEAALVLRGQFNGDQSADYGLSLLKLGALERKSGRTKEAAAHYAQAVRLLPGRPETAPVFLYLAISELNAKDVAPAIEHFQRAQSMDATLAGPVLMWTGYMHDWHGQPEEAEANYRSALGMEKPDSIQAFETLTLYSRFLRQHGREAEAQALEAQATAIRNPHPTETKQIQPPTDPPPAVARTATAVDGVHRVGGAVTQPSVLNKKDPVYSEEARVARYSASVLVQLVVGPDGAPQKIKVIRPAGFGLDDCAVATISQWRFKPGQKDGNPVAVYANIEVNFRLL